MTSDSANSQCFRVERHGDIAVIIPVRADKRSLFLVPWGELPDGTFRHVYIGTTDTDSDAPLDDPQCDDDDIDYVLTALNQALTEPVTRDDITGVWAGYRPLVKAASGVDVLVSEAIATSMTQSLQRAARAVGREKTAAIMHDIEDYHITPEEAATGVQYDRLAHDFAVQVEELLPVDPQGVAQIAGVAAVTLCRLQLDHAELRIRLAEYTREQASTSLVVWRPPRNR